MKEPAVPLFSLFLEPLNLCISSGDYNKPSLLDHHSTQSISGRTPYDRCTFGWVLFKNRCFIEIGTDAHIIIVCPDDDHLVLPWSKRCRRTYVAEIEEDALFALCCFSFVLNFLFLLTFSSATCLFTHCIVYRSLFVYCVERLLSYMF